MKSPSRAFLVGFVAMAIAALNPIPASAATLLVNLTGDAGDGTCDATCTLRDAILSSDLTSEQDTIEFNITPNTITPTASELPAIDQPVIIDGFSDPDSVRVELSGASLPASPPPADGLTLNGADSTIRGLVIRNFNNDGIDITASATGNRIESNYIGTDLNGTGDQGNGGHGVDVGGAANTIGGPGVGNVISGNAQNGVNITGSGATVNVVEGNFIGTNADGSSALGNTFHGVVITSSARDNVIGGTTAPERNVISANGQDGVRIQTGATANLVQGNFVGTNAAGSGALPNSADGLGFRTAAFANTAGGIFSGAGNLIFGNGDDGVQVGTVGDATTTRNGLLGNSISSNASLGIDLQGLNAVDVNDTGDGDIGGNNLQNFPVLTSALSATRVAIGGVLNSGANRQHRLEFFANTTCDASGNGEGQTFIGTASVTTDAAGNAAFNVSLPSAIPAGQSITATATDPDNNTSEFSTCRGVAADATPPSTPTTSAGGTFQKDKVFQVAWSTATDNLSGIFGYDVRYREAPYKGGFGGFVNWQKVGATRAFTTTTATSATFTGTPGTTYCFSARAIDGAGNASSYGPEGCTAVPVDNITFKHRGKWAKKTGAGYYLDTFSRTKQEGARLTLAGVHAKALSVIVTKCRSCGVIKVFFKGKLRKKIQLRSKAAARQTLRIVNLTPFASAETGTVKITVVSKRKLVIVEGLGVSAV